MLCVGQKRAVSDINNPMRSPSAGTTLGPVLLLRMMLLLLLLIQSPALAVQHTVTVQNNPNLDAIEESPLSEVAAVEQSQVLLPCDITPRIKTDEAILVLFYSGQVGTPIYSIDGRSGSIYRAKHWVDNETLQSRAYFDMTSSPTGLVLKPVLTSDHGHYRCRVDFRSSSSRNSRIHFTVIVPPRRLVISNVAGAEVKGVIGPYPIGSRLSFTCTATNGRPAPQVTWWHENEALDAVSEVVGSDTVANTLTIPSLTRDHLYRVLTCTATNSNLTQPTTTTVTLDITYPPLDVRIQNPNSTLMENKRQKFVCESSGSRPTATLSWWKDKILLTDTKEQVIHDGNVTRSTVFFTPSMTDHMGLLTCRAKNSMLPNASIEDSSTLNVSYTPRLSLAAGRSLDLNDIKEGEDVYFECSVNANPKISKVQWFHNGEELLHNVKAGVILSNMSLVLQRVSRNFSGTFTCTATNNQGQGSSNGLQLSVKFPPACQVGQKTVYGGGKNEAINVSCSVRAYPEPMEFKWAFNSSSDVAEIESSMHWQVGPIRSTVSYTPMSHMDYGTLLCWARNDVGMQIVPCVFHIIHASFPEPVKNCSVMNVTSTGASIVCQPGWNGGLTQTFTLSVTQAHQKDQQLSNDQPRVLAYTSASPSPEFMLSELEPGTDYTVTILAVNKKGQSQTTRLTINTPMKEIDDEMLQGKIGFGFAPILSIVMSSVAVVVISVLVITIIARKRRRQRAPAAAEAKMVYDKASSSPIPTHSDRTSEELNPDVIPLSTEHQLHELQETCPESSTNEGELKEKLLQNQPNLMYLHHKQQQHQQQHITPELHPEQQSLLRDYMPHGSSGRSTQFARQGSLPSENMESSFGVVSSRHAVQQQHQSPAQGSMQQPLLNLSPSTLMSNINIPSPITLSTSPISALYNIPTAHSTSSYPYHTLGHSRVDSYARDPPISHSNIPSTSVLPKHEYIQSISSYSKQESPL